MEISVEQRGDVDIITAKGTIHAADHERFAGELERLRKAKRFKIVISAVDLEYINSRAIGQLVQFSRDVRLSGGKLVLVRPGPSVEKILRAVGLLSLIPTYDNVNQAVAAFKPETEN